MLKEEILEFAQKELETTKIRYLGNRNGYEVYEPYELNEEQTEDAGGYPFYILIKNSSIKRISNFDSLRIGEYFRLRK